MCSQDKPGQVPPQPHLTDDLRPYGFFERRDGSLTILARTPSQANVVVAPLRLVPDRPPPKPSPQQLQTLRRALRVLRWGVEVMVVGLTKNADALDALADFEDAVHEHLDGLW